MVLESMEQLAQLVQTQSAHIVLSIRMSALPVPLGSESTTVGAPLAQTHNVCCALKIAQFAPPVTLVSESTEASAVNVQNNIVYNVPYISTVVLHVQ